MSLEQRIRGLVKRRARFVLGPGLFYDGEVESVADRLLVLRAELPRIELRQRVAIPIGHILAFWPHDREPF